jgi:TolA-binding protein
MDSEMTKRLQELQRIRERLAAQIEESEAVIASIEEKIEELSQRQEERMKADDRLSDEVVKNVVQGTSTIQQAEAIAQEARTYVNIVIKKDDEPDDE